MKLLEMNELRDAYLICFLSYFLIITNFLYTQDIPIVLYMGIVLLVTTATLISLSDHHKQLPTRQRLRLASIILAQALPLMMVLFILFPRMAGPFWSLPKDAHSGITGLSDHLVLGNVNQLSQSNEVAFRVKFEGAIPPPTQLYWRGPILWWTNGRDWKTGLYHHERLTKSDLEPIGQPVDYTVTLEPHQERWLLALDLPANAPQQGFITPDYQVLANFPVRIRQLYQLRSYPQYRSATQFNQQQSAFALQLPENKHPRARALAEQWRQENPQPQALVQRALNYFNQQPFIYTHTPPLLLNDPIDEFLFTTRQGFCEHYAASFTILMRAAKVPTRLVTGYLGGTINPIGNYLIVRQRDAHAWAEVWLPKQGWVRVDPTHAVSPERVEQGIDIALPEEFNPLGIEIPWKTDSSMVKLWQQFTNVWDAINNSWNQWVLAYGPERQQQVLNYLGLKNIDWRGMTIMLIIFLGGLLTGYAAWMLLRRSSMQHVDLAQQVYLRFCNKLARYGVQRHLSEGPLAFAARVISIYPEQEKNIQSIIELYVQTRYRSEGQKLSQLRQAVQRFRL
jgi:transglutaminase-like putative cysteine protease